MGLLVMSRGDVMPHLELLSVKTASMRRGIGGRVAMRPSPFRPLAVDSVGRNA